MSNWRNIFSFDLYQTSVTGVTILLMGDKLFLYLNYPCKFSLDFSYPVPVETGVRKKMIGVKVEIKGKKNRCVEH